MKQKNYGVNLPNYVKAIMVLRMHGNSVMCIPYKIALRSYSKMPRFLLKKPADSQSLVNYGLGETNLKKVINMQKNSISWGP